MLQSLWEGYGLYHQMSFFYPSEPATALNFKHFHSDAYVDFLEAATPENEDQFAREMRKFNVCPYNASHGECPVFDGLFEYCQTYATGSIMGARKLNQKVADIVVNWSGGMSHAKKAEASGFCYINDCVLAILELLKEHERVLYVDMDIHHCDGVEEAFFTTDRVMTVSFHKHEGFPGTGAVEDIGHEKGQGYSINVPLKEGIDDEMFVPLFKQIVQGALTHYQPTAIVMQCGAGSLSGDRFGCWNLSIQGHATCLDYVRSIAGQSAVPLLILGGGGFTLRNVSRLWLYESALLLGKQNEVSEALPEHEYYEYYAPDYKLTVNTSTMENLNTKEYIEDLVMKIFHVYKTHELPEPYDPYKIDDPPPELYHPQL